MGVKSLYTKLCNCISSQPCLHTTSWVIVKIVADISMVVVVTLLLMIALPFDPDLIYFPLIIKLAFIVVMFDLVFVALLSCGLSWKNAVTVTISRYYNVVLMVFVFVSLIICLSSWYIYGLEMKNLFGAQMIALTYTVDSLLLDISLAVTMQRDLGNLRNDQQNGLSKSPLKTGSQNSLLVPIEGRNLICV